MIHGGLSMAYKEGTGEKESSAHSLEQEMMKLLKRYEINIHEKINVFEWFVSQTLMNISRDKKVAIWGAGYHTEKLFQLIGDTSPISLIVDMDPNKDGMQLNGIKVTNPDAILTENIGVVIISAFDCRHSIKETLNKLFPMVDCVDFYTFYEGVILDEQLRPFYLVDDRFYNYAIDLHAIRCLIQKNTELIPQNELYCFYISQLIELKDFELLVKTVHEYAASENSDAEKFLRLIQDINMLFKRARTRIKERKTKDILLYVFDGMRNEDLEHMPNMLSLRQSSVSFHHAFSPSTYTWASFRGMFNGLQLDIGDYDKREVDGSKSISLKWLDDNNYKLFQHGGPPIVRLSNLVHIDSCLPHPLSRRLWDVMCELYDSEAPQFHLIHTLDTHCPFLCSEHKGTLNMNYAPFYYFRDGASKHEKSSFQYHEILSYIDEKVNRIKDILPPESTLIVCSDHGGGVGGGSVPTGHLIQCKEAHIHVPFFVYQKDLQPKEYIDLFSMIHFDQMIYSVCQDEEINEALFTSYVVVERDPIYSELWHSDAEVINKAGDWLFAFKMVRDSNYKYVLFETGNEHLYRLPNEEQNLINHAEYWGVLDQLRQKVSSDFTVLNNNTKK